jgi:hypothetical protein
MKTYEPLTPPEIQRDVTTGRFCITRRLNTGFANLLQA